MLSITALLPSPLAVSSKIISIMACWRRPTFDFAWIDYVLFVL